MSRFRPRPLAAALCLAVLTAVLAGAGTSGAATRSSRIVRHADAVPGRYIVVLEPGAARSSATGLASTLVDDHGGTVLARFGAAIPGYAARMTPSQAAATSLDPRVAYVEEDTRVSIETTQLAPPWGLDRIDQRSLPLDAMYTYGGDGAGVTAYVIDTGIRTSHAEFGGRAVSGFDAVDGGAANDCQGHGTHVAGTVGGATYGVAKQVTLVAVRVLDCTGAGYTSDVVAGIDWVTRDHDAGEPAVANMSLGGGVSSAMDQAVASSIADGVVYAVAAGNGDEFGNAMDACSSSPARVSAALTVSATDRSDRRPTWANVGSCVDLFAPGVGITSASQASDTSTATMSGTSMASPHVAGAAALYLSVEPSATPSRVSSAIVSSATTGVVVGPDGSPNRLLFEPAGTTSPSPTPGPLPTLTPSPTPSPTTSPTPPPGEIVLTVSQWATRRGWAIRLRWSGAEGSTVDVIRDDRLFSTTTNDGTFRDRVRRATGKYRYRICQTGSSVCSNEVIVATSRRGT